MKNMKKLLAMLMALTLSLSLMACGNTAANVTGSAGEGSAVTSEEAVGISFTVVVTDLEGKDTTFEYTSDKATVGEALLEEGLIEGDEGEYGLFINSVNGIAADWDADQTYWSVYIDGEYATTGVDSIEITEGATYSFVLTQG